MIDPEERIRNLCREVDELKAENLDEVRALQAKKKELVEALGKAIKVIDSLTTESGGLYEFHLNGDTIPWSDLLQGGRFEEWTEGLEDARKVLKEHTKEE